MSYRQWRTSTQKSEALAPGEAVSLHVLLTSSSTLFTFCAEESTVAISKLGTKQSKWTWPALTLNKTMMKTTQLSNQDRAYQFICPGIVFYHFMWQSCFTNVKKVSVSESESCYPECQKIHKLQSRSKKTFCNVAFILQNSSVIEIMLWHLICFILFIVLLLSTTHIIGGKEMPLNNLPTAKITLPDYAGGKLLWWIQQKEGPI